MTVRFQPQSAATFPATVTIPNDDGDESPYTFDITGTGTAASAPEITVLGNGTEIVNGDTTPSTGDDTDYGSTTVSSTVDRVFTIQNDGTADLTVGTVTVSDTTNFSVTVQPAGTVAGPYVVCGDGGSDGAVLGLGYDGTVVGGWAGSG